MSDPKTYRDSDGNAVSLETLCRREPTWAASRITVERVQRTEAEAERDRLLVAAMQTHEEFWKTGANDAHARLGAVLANYTPADLRGAMERDTRRNDDVLKRLRAQQAEREQADG